MRIVHTSDWHAGRVWKSVNRLRELGDVLENLGDYIERERTDLLIVSGDVFDTGAPAADAERLVFRFLKRVGMAGTHTVLVAGNHDNPARLDAWGTLAELVHVHVLGRPKPADRGGVVKIEGRNGDRAVVAAIPFAPARLLVSALEMAESDTVARQRYADSFRQIVGHLCRRFRADSVNLVVAHTHLDGAVFSGSERSVHLGEEWAAAAQSLPSTAHYVALGHIHRPQRVAGSPAPAYYAGSPLQLDFGEAGEQKVFMSVDARPGQPARIESVPYAGGKPLVKVRKTLEELEGEADALGAAGWLHVTVPLARPDADINARVRRLLPNAVVVAVELPTREEAAPGERPPQGSPPHELYRAYFRRQHGVEPEKALIETFNALYETTGED